MEEQKIEYSQMEVGYEFPSASFKLDPESVSAYLKATGESDSLYKGTGFVPPAAVAAWSLATLLKFVVLPSGTIHLSQEIQSRGVARVGDTLTCQAKVSRKQERSKLKLLNIDIDVIDQNHKSILAGRSAFNLP